jgi:hypothetical protein
MYKLLLATAAAAALFAAGAANATSTTAVSIWTDQSGVASDATLANIAALGAPNATTTVGAINFTTNDSTSTTVNQWLGQSLPDPTGSHILDNTVFLFSGSTFLAAGANNFSVLHDDGVELNIDGIGIVLSDPGPTSATESPFTVNASKAGFYKFELAYGECCGGPATVLFNVNGGPAGIPEPATWAMMLVGFGGMGAAMRSARRKQAVVA